MDLWDADRRLQECMDAFRERSSLAQGELEEELAWMAERVERLDPCGNVDLRF